MERMKRANSKVKDGLSTSIIDMLPEDREYASAGFEVEISTGDEGLKAYEPSVPVMKPRRR